jgi:hypothetical protein
MAYSGDVGRVVTDEEGDAMGLREVAGSVVCQPTVLKRGKRR